MFRFKCNIKLVYLHYITGQRDITVKHTEKQLRQRNVGKCNGSENKNDTVKLSFLLN